jgi:hypothetical protein
MKLARRLFLVAVTFALLLPLVVVHANFAYVNSAAAANGGATVNGVTAGNLLAACVIWYDTPSDITGVSGDSFVLATNTKIRSSLWNTSIWYVLSAAGGNTTATPSWSGGTPAGYSVHLYELSNAAGSAFDAGNKVANTSSNELTGSTLSVTTATANELLFSCLNNDLGTVTVPSGWDNTNNHNLSPAYYDHSAFLLDAGSAASHSGNWGWADSFSNYVESLAAFKAAGGGGGGDNLAGKRTLLGVGRR